MFYGVRGDFLWYPEGSFLWFPRWFSIVFAVVLYGSAVVLCGLRVVFMVSGVVFMVSTSFSRFSVVFYCLRGSFLGFRVVLNNFLDCF